MLEIDQAATMNKFLPAGFKMVLEDEECNFEVESDDEGQIVIGFDKPTSRQAQI